MTDAQQYTIDRAQPWMPLQRALVYQQANRKLKLFFELAGLGRGYDWVGGVETLAKWSEPAEVAISSESQSQIRARVIAWGAANGMKIGFENPVGADEMIAKMKAAGYINPVGAGLAGEWRPSTNWWERITRRFR